MNCSCHQVRKNEWFFVVAKIKKSENSCTETCLFTEITCHSVSMLTSHCNNFKMRPCFAVRFSFLLHGLLGHMHFSLFYDLCSDLCCLLCSALFGHKPLVVLLKNFCSLPKKCQLPQQDILVAVSFRFVRFSAFPLFLFAYLACVSQTPKQWEHGFQ